MIPRMPDTDIVIVGAGPAGLMAAIAAAEQGRQVLVLDRMPRPGVKLMASGGGRCNLTNTLPDGEFMRRFGRAGRFMDPALHALDRDGLLQFMGSIGVPTHCADGFHYFPVTESASDVQRALVERCRKAGVRFTLDCRVTELLVADGAAAGVATERGQFATPAVVLAAGGRSYPGLGSDGSGYALAQAAGHSIRRQFPALVPLLTRETWFFECAGATFEPARVWIDLPKCRGHVLEGAVLFTHQGVSGPAILDISGDVAERLNEGPEVPLRLNYLPGRTAADWERELGGWRRGNGSALVRNLLDRHLPQGFARALAAACGAAETRAANLTATQSAQLVEWLSAMPLHITGTEGFARAMVTRGGIPLKEVLPETLESRLVPRLFMAGEILDLDGPCGGYNLQWAFSSGWLAGQSAATAAAPSPGTEGSRS